MSIYSTVYDMGDYVDINGDGLIDFVASFSGTGGEYRGVWLNTGSGWQQTDCVSTYKKGTPWVKCQRNHIL